MARKNTSWCRTRVFIQFVSKPVHDGSVKNAVYNGHSRRAWRIVQA